MVFMGEALDFRTRRLPGEYDELAPDGSEIRVLMRMSGGQMTHCTLPPHETSDAIYHRTVEEICYCVRGRGVEKAGGQGGGDGVQARGVYKCSPRYPFPVQEHQ